MWGVRGPMGPKRGALNYFPACNSGMYVTFLARDTFVKTNRRAIAMNDVHPSVCLGRVCIVMRQLVFITFRV